MGDVVSIKKQALICGGCKYLGWKGLVKWCRHPKHTVAIRAASSCPDYIEWEAKIMPGSQAEWPAPISLAGEKPA